jgi:hypothetical protein
MTSTPRAAARAADLSIHRRTSTVSGCNVCGTEPAARAASAA